MADPDSLGLENTSRPSLKPPDPLSSEDAAMTIKPLSSAAKVFSITELREQVLVGLDFRTLLLSQRVDRSFRSTIQRNLKLRKKLFIEPVSSFKEALSLGFAEEKTILGQDCHDSTAALDNPVFVNPLVLQLYGPGESGWSLPWLGLSPPLFDLVIKSMEVTEMESWKLMLLTQPPLDRAVGAIKCVNTPCLCWGFRGGLNLSPPSREVIDSMDMPTRSQALIRALQGPAKFGSHFYRLDTSTLTPIGPTQVAKFDPTTSLQVIIRFSRKHKGYRLVSLNQEEVIQNMLAAFDMDPRRWPEFVKEDEEGCGHDC